MQVLCIEGEVGKCTSIFNPKPGEIYNSVNVIEYKPFRGINAWHVLEEAAFGDIFHITSFIDLPSEEGQSFKKETSVEIPQKLQPYYS